MEMRIAIFFHAKCSLKKWQIPNYAESMLMVPWQQTQNQTLANVLNTEYFFENSTFKLWKSKCCADNATLLDIKYMEQSAHSHAVPVAYARVCTRAACIC